MYNMVEIFFLPFCFSISEGKKLAKSYEAKFIETSAGIQHNVDELLVGVLKQIRLRQEQMEQKQEQESCSLAGPTKAQNKKLQRLSSSTTSSSFKSGSKSHQASASSPRPGHALSSPLHTLQVARDILARVCLNATGAGSYSKSCENLHVL